MEINSLSGIKNVGFGQAKQSNNTKSTSIPPVKDFVELSRPVEPPKVGYFRILFKKLSNEQIKQVNASGMLPGNAKFVPSRNGQYQYKIRPNWFNMRTGTRIIPEGFELKKSLFGFTKVVPKGTSGILIRDVK